MGGEKGLRSGVQSGCGREGGGQGYRVGVGEKAEVRGTELEGERRLRSGVQSGCGREG